RHALCLLVRLTPRSPLLPCTTRFRSPLQVVLGLGLAVVLLVWGLPFFAQTSWSEVWAVLGRVTGWQLALFLALEVLGLYSYTFRSEEHTSELQSRFDLVCRLLLEKKN